ncbi:MAG: DEAD/DEAH box helicase [Zetaproteobacteria bacterium]|nr:DEAD/DEAH box helicase [Zetaproteobacteria bacterium]
MIGDTDNKADIVESLYRHIQQEDWLEGVDLFQAGKVRTVEKFGFLYSSRVEGTRGIAQEVRLKLHPSGKVIQWIECTCKKNRHYGQYCEHIVALLMQLSQNKVEFLQKLDANMALKAPAMKPRAKAATKQTNSKPSPFGQEPKPDNASTVILQHVKDSIQKVSLLQGGPKIRIDVEVKPGHPSQYELAVDRAADFLRASMCPSNLYSTDLKAIKVFKEELFYATLVKAHEHEKIAAEKVFAVRYSKKMKIEQCTALKYQIEKLSLIDARHNVRSRPAQYILLSLRCSTKLRGNRFFYIPKVGYFPLSTHTSPSSSWHDLPMLKTYRGDQAAEFLASSYQPYQKNSVMLIHPTLKQHSVHEAPALSKVQVFKEQAGWFTLSPTYTIGKHQIPMADFLVQARKSKRKYIQVEDQWVKIPDQLLEHPWEVDEASGHIKADSIGLLRLKASLGEFDHFVGSKQLLGRVAEHTSFDANVVPPTLTHTKLKLRSYQEHGYKWCWWLYKTGIHGLLADDMGLGKTHQAMALISGIQKDLSSQQDPPRKGRFLIVCPTTVLNHWEDKVLDFAPEMAPVVYHGPKRKSSFAELGKKVQTIITSYGVLLRDVKSLSQTEWDCVILDEAHYVKNNNTATYKAACRLNSRIRVGLSGTPMENHLGELKNIFDFLVPGYLGSDPFFQQQFVTPINEQDVEAEKNLQRLIQPLKLRRTKSQVLSDLPDKVEDIRHCLLSPEQVSLYRECIQMRANPLVVQMKNHSDPIPYLHVFSVLQLLKQICNHPALVMDTKDYTKYTSGKFDLLKELIFEALESGNKVAIFSQYVKMIEIISYYLKAQNIEHVVMTGQTRARGKVIQKFQSDENVKIFVGSLLAGGVGIDLTAASVVIHYDRWWNASKEAQATDRVHRIGQKKFVQVMKLVTKGTLEEKIDMIINKKKAIFDKFLEHDEDLLKTLTRNDLLELLS